MTLKELLAQIAKIDPEYAAAGYALYYTQDQEDHPYRHPLLTIHGDRLLGGHALFLLNDLSERSGSIQLLKHGSFDWCLDYKADGRTFDAHGKTPEEAICRAWVAFHQLPGFEATPCKSGN